MTEDYVVEVSNVTLWSSRACIYFGSTCSDEGLTSNAGNVRRQTLSFYSGNLNFVPRAFLHRGEGGREKNLIFKKPRKVECTKVAFY